MYSKWIRRVFFAITVLLMLISVKKTVTLENKKKGSLMLSSKGAYLKVGGYDRVIRGVEKNGGTWFCLPSYMDMEEIEQKRSKMKVYTMNGAVLEDPCFGTVQDVILRLENGDEAAWKIGFFKSENLHTIYIDLNDKDVSSLSHDDYTTAGITEYDERGNPIFHSSKAEIKGRGNASWNRGEKHSYDLKLAVENSMSGMSSSKKWALLANNFDPTKMKNKIIYDMAEAIAMEYTVEADWIDVYIDNNYWGNYLLCKEPHIGTDGLRTDDLKKVNDSFLEIDKYEIDDEMKGYDYSPGEHDISGGYIFQYLPQFQYDIKKTGFIISGECFAIKSPNNASLEEVEYLRSFMLEKDAILKDPSGDPSTEIDFESFIQRFLLDEIAFNKDSSIASHFFYKKKGSDMLYAGPSWYNDATFGSEECNTDYNESILNNWYLRGEPVESPQLEYDAILYKNDQYKEQLVDCFIRYAPVFNDVLENKIDEYYKRISSSLKMDRIRWEGMMSEEDEFSYNAMGHYRSIETELRYLKFYLYNRLSSLAHKYGAHFSFYRPDYIMENVSHAVKFYLDDGTVIEKKMQDGSCIPDNELPEYDDTEYEGWQIRRDHCLFSYYIPIFEDMSFELRERN